MKSMGFFGVDTSNYTTSLALCDQDGNIIANLKRPLPVKTGERGLRQSDAVFHHTKNFPELFESTRDLLTQYSPMAIGVSSRPRSQDGSYMPCFLTGKAIAYAISATLGIPIYEFSHQDGHIMAALYSSGAPKELYEQHMIAFHVSGGTTEVLRVSPQDGGFSCELIGGTMDMNAGQAIDRVGVAMGLAFPCGPEMERLAKMIVTEEPMRARVCVTDGKCNLSGLENMALKRYAETGDKALIAKFVLDFIAETLARMTKDVCEKYPGLSVIYSGGVMSCSLIQARLAGKDRYFAEPMFSADNAAGIALLTRRSEINK